jgi:hypothetical protein
MRDITVNKEELLEKLRANRENHRAVFQAALEGYRTEALDRLEEKVAALRAGKIPDLKLGLVVPADHTRDYDRVIAMVEMDTSRLFSLSEYDFGSYVLDDWDWKRQFIRTSSAYAAEAVSRTYGDYAADEV